MTFTNTQQYQWPSGYRIFDRVCGPSAEVIHAFRSIPVAVISDCMGRNVGAVGLRSYHSNQNTVLCGPAFTVRVRPGDNLMIHKALMMVEAGDVLVIDGGGDLTQALVGGLIRTTCLKKKLGGLVIDGAIRDVLEWAQEGMPIYAKGHTHRGPSKDGPGSINIPVSCASLAVQPGDLVIGDADGVVSVTQPDLAQISHLARDLLEREKKIRSTNASGTADPERFNAILREKGLPI